MTNNIYFIANWKMYGSLSSINTLNKLTNLSKLKKYKNEVAIIDGDEKITYSELINYTKYVKLRLKKKHKILILIITSNSLDCLKFYISSVLNNFCIILLDNKLEKKFIIENFSIISPSRLLSSKKLSVSKNYKLPDVKIVDIGVKENGLRPKEIVTGFLARISDESEKYTLDLTKNLKDYFSKKKQKLIDDISKEEKKLKGIANDVKNKLKRFGIE